MADPYDIDLPSDWSASVSDGYVSYRDADGVVRVAVVAVVQGIRLYFRVDRRACDADERRPDSYHRDESAAADRAQELARSISNPLDSPVSAEAD